MWTVVKVQGTEVLRDVLDRWKAGIDAQAPECAAEVSPRTPYSRGSTRIALGARA